MLIAWIATLAFLSTLILTAGVRTYVIRKGVLDIPSVRSSHTKATPRGGGLAIAVVFFTGLLLLTTVGVVSGRVGIVLFGGGLLVAVVGWLDDSRGLSPGQRAIAHFIAAIWVVAWIGGFSSLDYGFSVIPLGWLGHALAVVGVVWMINLYNFMDGLDGLAASEAVLVSVFAGSILLAGGDLGLASVAFLLAGSAAGFLVWNWPPAKIFMGDVSSGLLGYVMGTLALLSERSGSMPALIWILLLAVFVVDATATLIRRVLQRERWYDAHRTHAYQLATLNGRSHLQVTLAVCIIDLALGGLAWLVWTARSLLVPALAISFGVLLCVWWGITRSHLQPSTGCKRYLGMS